MTPQLSMFRPQLDGLPPVILPAGCELRHFEPGDEGIWERVIGISFGKNPGDIPFGRSMLDPGCFLPERILFIRRDGADVATASAYVSPPTRLPDAGSLHYVGVLPGHTGLRLGYLVSLACLHRMRAEGRQRAILQTDDFRLPAIKTYLNLGFVPVLVDENQRQRWRDVFAALHLPELAERCARLLDGPVWQPPAIPPALSSGSPLP